MNNIPSSPTLLPGREKEVPSPVGGEGQGEGVNPCPNN